MVVSTSEVSPGYKSTLPAAFSSGMLHAAPTIDERFALVIGNQSYTSIERLKNPVADARAIRDRLESFHFDVVHLEDATGTQIENAFEALRGQVVRAVAAAKQTVVLLFFSGHGLNVDGKNFMLGIETEGSNLRTARSVRRNGVQPEELLKELQEYLGRDQQSRNMCICILDCCRNIPKFQLDSMPSRGADVSQGGLAAMQNRGGTMILYACDLGQTAADGDGPHGTLTAQLLKFMQKGTKPAHVFNEVSRAVDMETRESTKPQVPFNYSSHHPEDWTF